MKPVKNPQTVEAPTLSPERQLLWDAANYMEKHGWCRGVDLERSGRVCAVNAIAYARGRGVLDGLGMTASELLRKHVGASHTTHWSDSSDQETVVAAMRQAALS